MRLEQKKQVAMGTALMLAVLLALSCEDSDVTVPDGSTITLVANPASVQIDQEGGETEGSSSIVAQVLDSNNIPLEDVPLFFTTTAGTLTSGGQPTDTDDVGVATDTLTLKLNGDPNTVTVKVKGTGLEATIEITKVVNTGAVDPVAKIVATPATGQRTGLPFSFDGKDSTKDPNVELTCFDWKITSSKKVFVGGTSGCATCSTPGSPTCKNSCVTRTPTPEILTLTIGEEGDETLDQDLAVVLRVSDEPAIVDDCNNASTPDPSLFGPFPATLNYQLRCDATDPFVEAGPNQAESLSANGGVVTVTLVATASDPEDPHLDYVWDCGNGDGGSGQTVTCQYTVVDQYTATVIVTNDCGRVKSDSLVVTVSS